MSEYQIVQFRAVDRPLTDKQLEYMDRQSSRAEFTRWEYEVEYDYSSFHGDVDGMLRNGYDVFLTSSNFGCREIRLRLPNGLPFSESLCAKYFSIEGLKWSADEKGTAGVLSVAPYLEEAGDDDGDLDDYLDAATKLRELLIAGDLRALYVLWLCCAWGANEDIEDLMEPPVPHGLADIPKLAASLLPFFGLNSLLVEAAAIGIPAFNSQASQADALKAWLASIAESRQAAIIRRLISEDPVALKCELLSEIRDSQPADQWPVTAPHRTLAQLLEAYEGLRQKEDKKRAREAAAKAKREADKAEKQRQARMNEMKSTPEPWLAKASELVKTRSTENYREAASILADLRDAVGGEAGNKIARKHAAHLAKKYPTLNVLKSSLRKQKLLD